MRTIVLTLFYFLFTANIFAQSGWIQQNSNTDKLLTDVFFINDQKGWVVTDSSKVLRTTNGGSTWEMQTLPQYTPFNTVFFINENTGWVAGGFKYTSHHGAIYKTTNGGIDWFLFTPSGEVRDIYFLDQNTGFVAFDGSGDFTSGGAICRTTNNGLNWDYFEADDAILSLSFKNSSTGFAIGIHWDDTGNDSSAVYRTTNSGDTWELKYRSPSPASSYFGLRNIFAKGNKVWASGKQGVILFSDDDGENWIQQATPDSRMMNSVFFINENTGWGSGRNFHATNNIIKTTNGGVNWFPLTHSVGIMNANVFFVNENTGWTIGDYGVILKTTTGGLTSYKNTSIEIPMSYQLHQNYPNPFNPSTKIRFDLPKSALTKIDIYDISGKLVQELLNTNMTAGSYEIEFYPKDLTSGIYFYKLETNDFVKTNKMVLIK